MWQPIHVDVQAAGWTNAYINKMTNEFLFEQLQNLHFATFPINVNV